MEGVPQCAAADIAVKEVNRRSQRSGGNAPEWRQLARIVQTQDFEQ
jgi:hypothetical protein